MPDNSTASRRPGSRGGVREAFAARRRNQLCVLVPLLLLVIAVVSLADSRTQAVLGIPSSTWAPAIFSLIGGAVVYSFFNWRCPACNRYLGKQLSPRVCGNCGAKLQ